MTEAPATARYGGRTKVVLFGDSITQYSFHAGGWGQRLTEYFSRRADVLNRGFAGYNTLYAHLALQRLLPGELSDAALWTVGLGANDSMLPGSEVHLPASEYEANLCAILGRIQTASGGRAAIIVIGPPPKVDDQEAGQSSASSAEYAEIASRCAAAYGAEFLDMHAAMSSTGRPFSDFSHDGVHYNTAGNAFAFERIRGVIDTRLPQLAVPRDPVTGRYDLPNASPLPCEMPGIMELIDHANPAAVFTPLEPASAAAVAAHATLPSLWQTPPPWRTALVSAVLGAAAATAAIMRVASIKFRV
mmetsp:Transcript_11445/g.34663  ORF Transcript_11445/g.34663 Transcript_11445/m.34663 type:complete len:303 (-) Transcript_11445:66-974(-)